MSHVEINVGVNLCHISYTVSLCRETTDVFEFFLLCCDPVLVTTISLLIWHAEMTVYYYYSYYYYYTARHGVPSFCWYSLCLCREGWLG